MTILRTEGLTKKFPGVTALSDLDFELEKGEIHAVVGENGAGKSTLVKLLAGVYQPSSGKILMEGKEVHYKSPRDASSMVGVVHQERELVPHFNGYQNLFLGLEYASGGFLKNREMKKKADEFLQHYQLNVDLDLPAEELSSGQQEMLTILKVLFRDPKVVIFDEPTAPLSVRECEVLFELIHDLKSKGMTMIYISHHLSEVLSLADRITVLRNGEKVTTVNSAGVTEKEIINFMIARNMENQYPKVETKIGSEVIAVRNYSDRRAKIQNASFDIRSGEIVGFAGLVGAGRTELAKSVFGGSKQASGVVLLGEEEFRSTGPEDSIRKGIVMIPENRRQEGLLVSMSVMENLLLPQLGKLSNLGFIQGSSARQKTESVMEKLMIKASSPEQLVQTLSGGNQQKVSVGKWFGIDASVWIFDEPTQGIDVDAKTEIYRIMGELASNGAGIWFISSDLRELVAIADRIYVMKDFEILEEFKPPYDSKKILSRMLGEDRQ